MARPVARLGDAEGDWVVRAPTSQREAPPRVQELGAWLLGGFVLAIVMTWPLVLDLSTQMPHDAADPLAEAWLIAWGGHALRTGPLGVFDANAFWPATPSLAFSDSLLGYAPFGMIGTGATAAIVRYNVLFLFSYALAFAGGAYMGRVLGARPVPAAVAGVAFAFAPWRLAHNGHLNVLSIGGIPLALALLITGYRWRRPRRIVAGWLVAAWQVSLGFGMGIFFCYLLLTLTLATAAHWLRRGRPRPAGNVVRASLAGIVAFGAVTLGLALPYLDVLTTYPEARRDRASVEFFSPPPRGLLAAPAESRVWAGPTESFRQTLPWPPEQTIFPGVTVLVLAVAGLSARGAPSGLRAGLGVATAIATLLSLGLRFHDGRWTYGLLLEHAPGFAGLRTPGRLTVFTSLALALLAGLGTERLMIAVTGRLRGARSRRAPLRIGVTAATAIGLTLAAVVAAEGSTALRRVDVPAPPRGLAGLPDPQYHLPAGVFPDMRYMLWSTDVGFPRIGNGNTSFLPDALLALRNGSDKFPDAATVARFRAMGYRVVVLHPAWAQGTPWQGAEAKSIDGLGITREVRADVVVFDLSPPTSSR